MLTDENTLVSVVLKTLIDSFELKKAGVLIRKGTSNSYQSNRLIGFRAKRISLDAKSFLIRRLEKKPLLTKLSFTPSGRGLGSGRKKRPNLSSVFPLSDARISWES